MWFVIGAILQTTSYSFAQLVVGRFVGGVGVGLLSAVAPMYISEISPPNIRGSLLAMEAVTIVGGIVIMFYIVIISTQTTEPHLTYFSDRLTVPDTSLVIGVSDFLSSSR